MYNHPPPPVLLIILLLQENLTVSENSNEMTDQYRAIPEILPDASYEDEGAPSAALFL
jgi:hypothetical protein